MKPGEREDSADAGQHAAVVVKGRRGGGEDGHHGGGWKIAYADFMTAMMAFFLVMWLVNSTDEKTIVQVAAYFNPLRLSEKTPSQKGMHDGNIASVAAGAKGKGVASDGDSKSKEAKEANAVRPKRKREEPSRVEAELFAAPGEVLDGIAARSPASYIASAKVDAGQVADDRPQDPWRPLVEKKQAAKQVEKPVPQSSDARVEPTPTRPPAEVVPAEDHNRLAARQAMEVGQEVADLMERVRGRHPAVEVRRTSEGLLISLMDSRNFGMFSIASAEPRPELVVLLQEIGRILSAREGGIVVRGHTDGRPYRTEAYDNWRLSTSRAHAARFMLVRGGVAEARFEKIEGHADREPRNRADPDAAENRRIDILLRIPK